jgi:outer membrane protein assembly factor BamB
MHLLARLFLIGCSCLALVRGATGEDWPRWGGPRGDASWKGPDLPENWPAQGLTRRWKVDLGGGYGGVSVVEGRVYVMDRQTEPHECERLVCFDAKTGKRLWSYEYMVAYGKLDYGNGPRSTPTVHAGRVYILGAVGYAACIDARSGEKVWAKDLADEPGIQLSTWGLAASPLIFENLVVLHPGAKNGGCLMALDRATGNEVWRASEDPAGYATPVLIDAPSGKMLIAWTPEHILGLDPQNGKIHWSVPYSVMYGVSIATPIYREETVFVSGYWAGSKAIRLGKNPQEAQIVWEENRFLRGLMAQPLYRDGLVYTIDKAYGLTCFELATGKKLWDDGNRMTPRGQNPQATLVWLGESRRAIILNELGDLILARLDRQGYHEQSRTHIIDAKERQPIWAHPAYAGTRVFARSDTELICVELVSDP